MTESPVLVLAGPTAVGKGTVVKQLRSLYPNIAVSISATTRPARPGEVDGEHYYFVSDQQFDDLIASQNLLEWAVVHGKHRYGTPRAPIEELRAAHVPVILEIDLDGARQVRQTMPDAQFVFLMPPSWEEMVRRLEGRGTESEAQQRRRLETARVEIAAASEFDFRVTNDNVEDTARELARIMGLD